LVRTAEIMSVKYDFNIHFQENLLAMMVRNKNFIYQFKEVLKPEYFEKIVHSDLCKLILNLTDSYGQLPTPEMLKEEVDSKDLQLDSEVYEREIDKIYSINYNVESKYTCELLIKFAKHQAMKSAILESAKLLEQDRYEQIEQLVKEAIRVGENLEHIGIKYFDNPEKRLTNHETEVTGRIRTMIKGLDDKIGGGLGPGELGVVLGFKGRGKTAFLIWLARGAIFQGKKVVYYTLEMSESHIAIRLDSALSGYGTGNLSEYSKEVAERLKWICQLFKGDLIIKQYPTKSATVSTLESHLEMLGGSDFVPDLIIVDYADELKSSRYYEADWQEQKQIYAELRGLAVKRGVPIWTASQVVRSAKNKSIVDLEHVAYSFPKLASADIVLSLSQTEEERERGEMRIFVAHQRHNPSYGSVNVSADWSKMMIKERSDES